MEKSNTSSLISYTPPGISWTAPDKGRPWSQPPKFVDIKQIAGYYMLGIGSQESMNEMMDAVETGIPLSVIAQTMMMTSVSKGLHSLDTGILIMPVIIEMLQTIAMMHDVKFVIYPDDYDKQVHVSPRVARLAVEEAMKKLENAPEPVPQADLDIDKSVPVGLMSKRKEVV